MKKKEQKLSTYKGEKRIILDLNPEKIQKKSQKIPRSLKKTEKPENPKSKVVFSNIFRSYSQVFRT